MKINHLGTFCDSVGNEYEVIEEIEEISYTPLHEPPVKREGRISYKTTCGEPLNAHNGSFITLDDEVLKRKAT